MSIRSTEHFFSERPSYRCFLHNDHLPYFQYLLLKTLLCRSSCLQMFFKIRVLKNFANFTGKHLCWSLFLKKFLTLFLTLLKTLQYRCFPVKFAKKFKNTFFYFSSSGCFWLWDVISFTTFHLSRIFFC